MLSKIIHTFLFQGISAILGFLLVVITSQELGAEGKGQISLFTASFTFFINLCQMVGGSALIYYGNRIPIRPILILSYSWSFLLTIIIYPILFYFKVEYAFWICMTGFVYNLLSINLSILLANQKFELHNWLKTSIYIFHFCIFLFIIYVLGIKKMDFYCVSLNISLLFVWIFSFVKVLQFESAKYIDKLTVLKTLLKGGVTTQIANFFSLLTVRFNLYIIAFYLGDAEVGRFSNAIALGEILWIVNNSVSIVQYAKISAHSNSKFHKLITIKSLRLTFFPVLLGSLLIGLFPDSLFVFIFGKDFQGLHKITSCILPGIVIFSLSNIFAHYFSGIGKFNYSVWISILGLIVLVVADFVFLPIWGLKGAALAGSISYIFMTMSFAICFKKESNVSWRRILIPELKLKGLFKKSNFKNLA